MDTISINVPIKTEVQDTPTEQFQRTTEDAQDEYDVRALSDAELREQLCLYGICPGPILPSTRTVYEKKLVRLMKKFPKKPEVTNSENYGEKGKNAGGGEMVFESDSREETTECTADNKPGVDVENRQKKLLASDTEYSLAKTMAEKPGVDVENRQKKLLASDTEYSLAKIVAELQEMLPEGKGATHRFQGQRKKLDSNPERVKDHGEKKTRNPSKDYGYADIKVTDETSTKRRQESSIPSSMQCTDVKIKSKVAVTPESGFLSSNAKIALFILLVFLVGLFLV